jgi:hypothetical protein
MSALQDQVEAGRRPGGEALTEIAFRDGRNPAVEIQFASGDYVVAVLAIDALARSAEAAGAGTAGERARALRAALADELRVLSRGRLELDAATRDARRFRAELALLAEDEPDNHWMLMTWRLPVLSGPSEPGALAAVATALLEVDHPRALELLLAIDAVIDRTAVEAASAALRGPHAPTLVEHALATAAGQAYGWAGELFWNPDTATAWWVLSGTSSDRATELRRRTEAVPGVEQVVVRHGEPPSADARAGTDPSWVKVQGVGEEQPADG